MSLTKVSYSMISGAPVNIIDYGAVGDSDGTTGNGTDNTVAIQAAVDYANANGLSIYVPSGTYRITAPIDFTGVQAKCDFIGESNFNTVIFADFTSVTPVAAFSVANTNNPRAYVGFKNFAMVGISTANVSAIYSNFGSEFTEFDNVWVRNFYNGFVIATNYNVKLINCQAWYCENNGFQVGFTIAGVLAPANNVAFIGCLATYNKANGYYVAACRALGMVQCDGEANDFANIYLDGVFGGSLTGIYMEYASVEVGNPTAQLYIKNCTGISVNGLSVSAFDNNSNPVILVEDGCNGIILNAIAIETAGSPTAAVGLLVKNSFGVALNSSYFNGMTTGVYVDNSVRLSIRDSNFSNCTNPLVATGAATQQIHWNQAIPAQVTASAPNIASNVSVDVWYIDNTKNVVDGTNVFYVNVSYTDLASGATKKIIDSTFAGERWRIIDIIAVGLTDGDAGGNRDLAITDGTSVYTAIPSATLQITNFQGRWGSADVPFSAIYFDMIQPTVAGSDLVAVYSGGTTDYITGDFALQITAERIV